VLLLCSHKTYNQEHKFAHEKLQKITNKKERNKYKTIHLLEFNKNLLSISTAADIRKTLNAIFARIRRRRKATEILPGTVRVNKFSYNYLQKRRGICKKISTFYFRLFRYTLLKKIGLKF
jgi:hypothetical protein